VDQGEAKVKEIMEREVDCMVLVKEDMDSMVQVKSVVLMVEAKTAETVDYLEEQVLRVQEEKDLEVERVEDYMDEEKMAVLREENTDKVRGEVLTEENMGKVMEEVLTGENMGKVTEEVLLEDYKAMEVNLEA
jgi:hypothetical protein